MSKTRHLYKWNLKENKWSKLIKDEEKGSAFTIVNYGTIMHNPNGKYNFIIISNGSRVKDNAKNYNKVNENKLGMDVFIKYFKEKGDNYNYKIKSVLMDEDAPIIEAAQVYARFVDFLATKECINTITLVGHSKCGTMNLYIPRFFKKEKSFQKVNIVNIASPYTGTKLASPRIFLDEIKNVIPQKFGKNKISQIISNKLITLYNNLCSNSHMDYDIALPGGIPCEKLKLYDEHFIENIFCAENLSAIKKVNFFKNVTTHIDRNTLKEAIKTLNFYGIGLCALDKLFFENESDGVVPLKTQKEIEKYLHINSYSLYSHHSINSNKKVFKKIVQIVSDEIDEANKKRSIV